VAIVEHSSRTLCIKHAESHGNTLEGKITNHDFLGGHYNQALESMLLEGHKNVSASYVSPPLASNQRKRHTSRLQGALLGHHQYYLSRMTMLCGTGGNIPEATVGTTDLIYLIVVVASIQ
jgi:hypothetical protein